MAMLIKLKDQIDFEQLMKMTGRAWDFSLDSQKPSAVIDLINSIAFRRVQIWFGTFNGWKYFEMIV